MENVFESGVYWLLGLTSVAGLSVVVWRGWMLRWGKVVPPAITSALAECHTFDDVAKLRAQCDNHPSPLGRLIVFAANHLEWSKAENTSSLETAARREVVRLERGLVVLEIIIGMFNDIGESGLNNASKLAHGISLILQTTLIGLLIAIPALVTWGYFSKKVEVLAVEMESLCDEFIRRQYADKK